jgi:Domain of unknown function (DUF4136)
MKFLNRLVLILVSILVVGCVTGRPNVETDHQAGFSFAGLKTFKVIESKQETKADLLVSPFTLSHIHAALESELSKRYQSVAGEDKPDFTVTYHVIVEEKIDPNSYNELYGFGVYGRGYYRYPYPYHSPYLYGPANVRVYNQGSLIIDIADAKTDKPIWRGVSEKRLGRSMSPAVQREVLSKAVTEVLSQFPPVN